MYQNVMIQQGLVLGMETVMTRVTTRMDFVLEVC